MVSLSLPIVRVLVFLELFSIGHTFITSMLSKIDLDLQSPVVPSGVISNSPFLFRFCIAFHFASSESYEIVFIVADSEVQHQGFCLC
jgi:hypothetical protein